MHGRKSLISFTEFIKLLQMYSLCICLTTMQWRTTTIAVVILKPIWSTRKPDPALEMNLPAPESEDQSPATNPCVAALSGSSASLSEQSIGDVRKKFMNIRKETVQHLPTRLNLVTCFMTSLIISY